MFKTKKIYAHNNGHFLCNHIFVFVSTQEKGHQRTMRQNSKVKRHMREQRNMFGARIKNMKDIHCGSGLMLQI